MSVAALELPTRWAPDLGRLDAITFDLNLSGTLWSGKLEESIWKAEASVSSPDEDAGEEDRETIFRIDGWLFPLHLGTNMAMHLDAAHVDSEVFVPLTDSHGRLRDKYAHGLGEHLVIANMARLAPAWRGMGGVGRYLAGSVFLMLRDMAACIAMHPSPYELTEHYGLGNVPDDEWDSSKERLTKLWRTLGARSAPGGNLVIDPSLIHLDRAVERLGRKLGVHE
jgi:hypothetical protein